MTQYKAGDKITVNVDLVMAKELNNYWPFMQERIIAHDPAPEPVVVWSNVFSYGASWSYKAEKYVDDCSHDDRIAKLKITITGKQVTAEVIPVENV